MENNAEIATEKKTSNNEEEFTPQLFSEEPETNEANQDSESSQNEKLFDQDIHTDEEDFVNTSIFEKTKILMQKFKSNEHTQYITGIIPFSSDVK